MVAIKKVAFALSMARAIVAKPCANGEESCAFAEQSAVFTQQAATVLAQQSNTRALGLEEAMREFQQMKGRNATDEECLALAKSQQKVIIDAVHVFDNELTTTATSGGCASVGANLVTDAKKAALQSAEKAAAAAAKCKKSDKTITWSMQLSTIYNYIKDQTYADLGKYMKDMGTPSFQNAFKKKEFECTAQTKEEKIRDDYKAEIPKVAERVRIMQAECLCNVKATYRKEEQTAKDYVKESKAAWQKAKYMQCLGEGKGVTSSECDITTDAPQLKTQMMQSLTAAECDIDYFDPTDKYCTYTEDKEENWRAYQKWDVVADVSECAAKVVSINENVNFFVFTSQNQLVCYRGRFLKGNTCDDEQDADEEKTPATIQSWYWHGRAVQHTGR